MGFKTTFGLVGLRGLAALLLGLPLAARAGGPTGVPFTPGNIVVTRVGVPGVPSAATATATFLDEYTPTGRLVQSIALPITPAASGFNRALTLAGGTGFSTEGALNLSTDGKYLVFGGYNAAPGATLAPGATTAVSPAVPAAPAAAPDRVIARVAADGTIDTRTSYLGTLSVTSGTSGGNNTKTNANSAVLRSVTSVDGSAFWVASSSKGASYTTFPAYTAAELTQLSTSVTNLRTVGIANGQLYASAASGLFTGVDKVGTGLPTAAGNTVTNEFGNASGDSGSNGPSPYGFQFFDLDPATPGVDVCYVADARTVGNGPGIQKWSKTGATTWTLNGIIANPNGVQGVTGVQVNGSGNNVKLFVTAANGIYTVTDNTGYNVAPSATSLTQLVAASANTALRGVAFAPVANTNPNITIASVSPTPVCATTPQSLAVTYGLNSSFNAGNVFTAELSDATGSFGSPVVIGSVTSATATSIAAIIPAGTPSGSGYRVRITASNPVFTGQGGNPFTIVSNPTVTLSPSATQNITASNNGTTLTGTENPSSSIPATTRQFYAGTSMSGPFSTLLGPANATSYIPNFATPGTYYVVLKSTFATCATVTSAPVQITVAPNTSTATIAVSSGSSIANGGTFTFPATTIAATSAVVNFTISNSSATDALNIASIVFANSEFKLSGTAPTTVAAGGNATLSATFTPSVQGTRTGSVTINSNDVTNGTFVINFTGVGNAPVPTLSSISPNSIVAGLTTTVTFNGTNFVPGATVNYGIVTGLATTYVSSTSVRAVITPAANTPATTYSNVTVTNPNPGGSTSAILATPVTLSVTANPSGANEIYEPFEAITYTTYAPGILPLTTGNWYFSNTLLSNNDANDKKLNAQSARIRTEGNAVNQEGYVETRFDKPNGVSSIKLQAAVYGVETTVAGAVTAPIAAANIAASLLKVEVSNDGGLTWTAATATIGPLTASLTPYTVSNLNVAGNVRIRIRNITPISASTSATIRLNVDDVEIFNYTNATAAITDLPTVSTALTLGAPTYRNVTVATGGNLTLKNALTTIGTLTVQSGGSLTLAGDVASDYVSNLSNGGVRGSGNLVVEAGGTVYVQATDAAAHLVVAGTSDLTNADFVYNGAGAQTGADLPATVRNLTVNNASNVTLTRALSLRQVLHLTNGDFSLDGGSLTLLSVAGQGTALVDNTGGVVTGTATMQRAVDVAGTSGYHQYSSPVQSTTLADLDTPGFSNVYNSAYNSAPLPGAVSPFPTVYDYDETRLVSPVAPTLDAFNQGWHNPSRADIMAVGKGYTVNAPNSGLVDFVGFFNTGTVNISGLTKSSATGSGFHLVGNPYPSPLNWDLVLAGRRPNITGSMYIFNSSGQYSGTYLARTNGIGSSTGIIPAGAAFFVEASTVGTPGSIQLLNTDRVTTFGSQPAFGRNTADVRPQLRLTLTNAAKTLADDAYVYLQAGATTGVDAGFDAAKLPNPNGLNLAALAGARPLAIDGLPLLASSPTLVPLTVAVPAAGSYALTANDFANFGTTAVVLRDLQAGTRTVLAAGISYRFTSGLTANGRFVIELNPAASPLATAQQTLTALVQVYPNPAHGQFHVTLPASATAALAQLVNGLGQVVSTRALSVSDPVFSTSGLAAGVYTLRLTVDGTSITRKVVID